VIRPSLALGGVVVLLALGTGAVSAVGRPPAVREGERLVEVQSATAVCPDVHQEAGLFQTRISVGAAPLPAGRTAGRGQVVTSLIAKGGAPVRLPLTDAGQVAVNLGRAVYSDGVVVDATQAQATGLEVEQVARVSNGPYRGLAGVRCVAPQRDLWFVGSGATLNDRSVLVLANVDDTPATVDVTAFGRRGAGDARTGQGLTIAPRSRLSVPVENLAPDLDDLVVHVSSRQGRVVAVLRHNRVQGRVPQGFDYVPQAVPPATSVVVPGIPAGPGYRSLIVGNPSGEDTTVSIRATVTDGQFVPTGMEEVQVPAHRTVRVNLSTLAATTPVTATVTSSGAPVVASAFLVDVLPFQTTEVRDISYGGSSGPLTGPALVTDLVINRATESTLLLTAPDAAASVVVTPITVIGAASAPPAPRTVRVPAGRTVAFRLSTFFPPGTQAQLAVEVRPQADSGPVYASRFLKERGGRGALATLLTLQGPAQLVPRPTARQDDEAGYP